MLLTRNWGDPLGRRENPSTKSVSRRHPGWTRSRGGHRQHSHDNWSSVKVGGHGVAGKVLCQKSGHHWSWDHVVDCFLVLVVVIIAAGERQRRQAQHRADFAAVAEVSPTEQFQRERPRPFVADAAQREQPYRQLFAASRAFLMLLGFAEQRRPFRLERAN